MDLNKIVEGYKSGNYSEYIDNLNKKLANIGYKLYRYIPIESLSPNIEINLQHEKQYGLKSLFNNYIYHNKPSFFNDPFDCVFGMGVNALFRESLAEIANIKDLSKFFTELGKEKNINNFEQLYLEIDKIPMENSVKKYLLFIFGKIEKTLEVDNFDIELAMDSFIKEMMSSPSEFMGFLKPFISDKLNLEELSERMKLLSEKIGLDNLKRLSLDPINPNIEQVKELSLFAGVLPDAEKIEIKLNDSVNDFNNRIFSLIDNKFGIASLTSSFNNPLMWSHYASSHRGICIEYDFKDYFVNNIDSKPFLSEITYSNSRITLDASILDRIDLKNIEKHGKFDIVELFLEGLFTKYIAWEYEQEWRSIIPIKSDGNRELEISNISAIYLGNKMEDNVAKEIIHILKDRDFAIYKMKNEISEYKMTPQRIK